MKYLCEQNYFQLGLKNFAVPALKEIYIMLLIHTLLKLSHN
jgi:hypothetical protein